MRRILRGLAAAALMTALPALASAGNQETAEWIANRLRESGQLSDYRIGVKCQEGTVWLRGQVTDRQQMTAALKLAARTPGVSRVINQLSVPASQANAPVSNEQAVSQTMYREEQAQEPAPAKQSPVARGDLAKRLTAIMARGASPETPAKAQRLSNSFTKAPARTVSVEEWQEEEAPQPMAPSQRVRPMNPQRVAMQSSAPCPTAYNGGPMPMHTAAANGGGVAPARYDQPCMPNYAWPSYAAYPNYAAVTYPKQYSPTAWPYIGPFYPYPQVPLGWRKVTLEWDDGWWFLDFKDQPASCWHR